MASPLDNLDCYLLITADSHGFDLEQLVPIAARVGPTRAESAEPLAIEDSPTRALECPGFAPERQRSVR